MKKLVGAIRHALSTPRGRALVLLALLISPPLTMIGCIQPHAVFEPFSTVNVQIDMPPPFEVAGVRVAITGSGLTAGDNDFAFTDSTGFAAIRTKETGFHYIVARHARYDLTYGGTAANLDIGGDFLRFQRGRLVIPALGSMVSPDYFFPFSGVDQPPQQILPRRVGLRKKVPGKARFVFFLEDSPILKRTFQPDQANPAGKVYVTGDFNNFNLTLPDENGLPLDSAKELFDDGGLVENSGDDEGADGVFTRVLDLEPGEHTYVFLVNGISIFVRDPYEEFSKSVRATVRNPLNNLPNQNLVEIREFRASAVTVTEGLEDIPN